MRTPRGSHLAGAEDDAELELRRGVLRLLQALPADADGHRAQLLVHPEVVGVLCGGYGGGREGLHPISGAVRPTEPTEPNGTRPDATEAIQTHRKPSGPNGTQPDLTEPNRTQWNPTGPNGTHPDPTEPNRTQRNPTGPNRTQPDPMEPIQTQWNPSRPNGTHLEPTEPDRKSVV